jgi:hypothetical protein
MVAAISFAEVLLQLFAFLVAIALLVGLVALGVRLGTRHLSR